MRGLGLIVIIATAACTTTPVNPLLTARDHDDRRAIRAHAWQVWADLTRDGAAAWERWSRSDEVFSDAPLAATGELAFRAPHAITQGGVPVAPAMEHQLYFVALNRPAAQHVRAHELQHKHATKIPDFPTDATAIKLVWYPVRARGVTEVPVWDADPTRDDDDGNPPSTWRRKVAVSFDGAGDTIPIARFYHRPLATDREVATARVAWHDDSLMRGDEVVLVGIHATTKAIPDWTWATYWWHDRPDDGPFAAGRPASVAGWAASYLMDTTLGPSASCMNPWLEARFPGGLVSNCVTCHQRAAYGAAEFLPITQGPTPAGDPYFAGKAATDFMWSVALESR